MLDLFGYLWMLILVKILGWEVDEISVFYDVGYFEDILSVVVYNLYVFFVGIVVRYFRR